MIDIIENIIALRKQKGYTQKTLSDKIKMPQANYARIETKETQLTIDKLEKISNALEMPLEEIITYGSNATQPRKIEDLQNKIKQLEGELENSKLKIELLKTHANLYYQYILDNIYHSKNFNNKSLEEIKEPLIEAFIQHPKLKKYIELNLISENEIEEMVSNIKRENFLNDELKKPTIKNTKSKK
jgi:transcriptional regulator with XRE-family HTH domain